MALRGNLHAIEYMLGQLYVQLLEKVEDPQAFLLANAKQIEERIRRPNAFDDEEKDAAYGTVMRVMETASTHFEAVGKGPMINLRS